MHLSGNVYCLSTGSTVFSLLSLVCQIDSKLQRRRTATCFSVFLQACVLDMFFWVSLVSDICLLSPSIAHTIEPCIIIATDCC
jgi:hypothetical protein